LHDDGLLALAISSDGRYITSAGLDKKIYLWSIEAALKKGGDQVRVRVYIAVISLFSNRRCILATHSPSQSSGQVIQVLVRLSHYVSLFLPGASNVIWRCKLIRLELTYLVRS
jgi:WD40 repeat protein